MKKILGCLSLVALTLPAAAQAAGFYLQEQSVRGQGAAFAGAVAHAKDASTIFFNPAGMTALDGAQAAGGVSIIMPRASFRDNGTTAGMTAGAQAGHASTYDGGNPFEPEAVPAFYAAAPYADGAYWFGLGVSAPFGLANEYAEGWFGRYDSTKSELRVIDIAPVIATRVTDTLSIGGGINIQYADALLESALPCPNAGFGCGAAFDPASDGKSRLEGDGWDIGFNAGIRWEATPQTTLGAHYRSAVSNDIPGIATVAGLGGVLAANNGARAATAKLKLPDILGLGVAHKAREDLTLLASYNYFGWDNFDNIPVVFDNGDPASISPQAYRNSYSVALGAEWRQSETFTWRGGVQYDMTPTTDAERSTRTPDGDRYWLSAGMTYAVSEHLSIDAAATHIIVTDGDVDLTRRIYEGTAADTTARVRGTSDNKLNILSLQAVWKF